MTYEKITKKEFEIIVDMYETVAPTWSDDHSEEGDNQKETKIWYKTLRAILKRNGYDVNQIFKP